MTGSAIIAFREGLWMSLPFILLFGLGYGWLAAGELWDRGRRLVSGARSVPEGVSGELRTVGSS
jgi:hypothetical protein